MGQVCSSEKAKDPEEAFANPDANTKKRKTDDNGVTLLSLPSTRELELELAGSRRGSEQLQQQQNGSAAGGGARSEAETLNSPLPVATSAVASAAIPSSPPPPNPSRLAPILKSPTPPPTATAHEPIRPSVSADSNLGRDGSTGYGYSGGNQQQQQQPKARLPDGRIYTVLLNFPCHQVVKNGLAKRIKIDFFLHFSTAGGLCGFGCGDARGNLPKHEGGVQEKPADLPRQSAHEFGAVFQKL
jgi:hypothetical protein